MNALVNNQRRSLLICLLAFLQLFAQGQLTANFSASPQSGCAPLIVQFTDASTGNPSQWKWDLGNGATSTLKHPSATYFNPGTYTIKLVVKKDNAVDSVIKTAFITVYAKPIVKFGSSDTIACAPANCFFTDSSTASSGSIASWQWDFGDGSLSSQQNPSHVYSAGGNYNVTLKVVNSAGCVQTLSKPTYVKISAPVHAAFSHLPANTCTAPASLQFTNTSTGGGTLSYSWNFGDGNTSSLDQPLHNYASVGTYTVSLAVSNASGCTDTLTIPSFINIGMQAADFSLPLTACVGTGVSFINTSSPAPSTADWNFGDGNSATALNGQHVYNAPGAYTVRMMAGFGACADTVIKQITVLPRPKVSFTASDSIFCKGGSTVNFSSTVPGTRLWLFGDGQSSTAFNPSHTYASTGNFDVTLIITNASGCSDTLTKTSYIRIANPEATIHGLPQTGCVPVLASLSASVVSSEPVQSWQWSFGDGTTSTAPSPSHSYGVQGNYDVSLVILTASGCTDTVKVINGVRAGNKPVVNFTYAPPVVCNLYPVYFHDSTDIADQWLWDFGDASTSTQQNPVHVFNDMGIFTVTLIAWNNTCADTIVKSNIIRVLPPIAALSASGSCNNKYTKQFTNGSYGAKSYHWDFGDGTTSTQFQPTHTYAAPGNYQVVLTAYSDSCHNMNSLWVKVVDEPVQLSLPAVVCRKSAVTMTAGNVNAANIASWHWDFGDGHVSTQAAPFTYSYTTTGQKIVTLTVTDILGCTTTARDTVMVNGPTAAFTASDSIACLAGNNIGLNSTSSSDGVNAITQWSWHFGDGSMQTSSSGAAAHHSYTAAGSYSVSLTVSDASGCSDSAVVPVLISQPQASFYSPDTLACNGSTVAFGNTSGGTGLQFDWSFGDGGTANTVSPVHSYATVGNYTVKLTLTDFYGCTDSMVRPAYIKVSMPQASFLVSDSFGTCPPLMVHFTNTSSFYSNISWDFGDGSYSTLANPSHYYSTAGVFYAKLIVTGPGGCTDTAVQKITVLGPSGQFTYAPLSGCNPLQVQFTIQALQAASFHWDFSDGVTQPSTAMAIQHTYTTAGEFVPKLILVDAAGCSVPLIGTDTVRVIGVNAQFSITSGIICGSGPVQFNNQTIANDYIASYHWNFGDGGSSNDASPTHLYASAGNYPVQLIAVTASGCRDTVQLSQNIEILSKPEATITGLANACAPASLSFTATVSGAVGGSYAWNFGNGQSASQLQPPAQNFTQAGAQNISFIVTAANGCSDTATHIVTIHPKPLLNAGADLSICKGTTATLQATGASTYQWNAASGLSCNSCAQTLAAPLQSTVYIVTGISSAGCTATDTVMVTVHQPITIKATGGDTICAGQPVHLSATGAQTYSWTPAATLANPSSASTSGTPQTTTTFTVIGKDGLGCFSDTAAVFVKVWPIPTVSAGADRELVVGDALQLATTTSADVKSWQWNPAYTLSCNTCSTTLAKPKQTTTYAVRVENEGGCSAIDAVTIHVICNNGNLYMPNTFSPNADGVNDVFFPAGKGIAGVKSLRVFNRWGQVVFEKIQFAANDAAAGWNGSFNGQALPPDVYIYACDVICGNGEVLSYKGDVTLIR